MAVPRLRPSTSPSTTTRLSRPYLLLRQQSPPPRRHLHATPSHPSKRSLTPRTAAPSHSSLPSFLHHARATRLSPHTRVFQGTVYEYLVQHSLSRLGLRLTRRGGRGDKGVDLAGTWTLPSHALRVCVQCKSVARMGPHVVREMEGAFRSFAAEVALEPADPPHESTTDPDPSPLPEELYGPLSPTDRDTGLLGLVVTRTSATRGVLDALRSASHPLAFALVDDEGVVAQLIWNARAGRLAALAGMSVQERYVIGTVPLGGLVKAVAEWREEWDRLYPNGSVEDDDDTPASGDVEYEGEDVGATSSSSPSSMTADPSLRREVVLTQRDGSLWDFAAEREDEAAQDA